MTTEQYIFVDSAYDIFEDKLRALHRRYVDTLVMVSADQTGMAIEDVKMSRLNHPLEYCAKIIGGFQNLTPSVRVSLRDDEGDLHAELICTHIDDGDYVDHMYMIQNVHNYPQPGYTLYQVWYLNKTTAAELNTLWSD